MDQWEQVLETALGAAGKVIMGLRVGVPDGVLIRVAGEGSGMGGDSGVRKIGEDLGVEDQVVVADILRAVQEEGEIMAQSNHCLILR